MAVEQPSGRDHVGPLGPGVGTVLRAASRLRSASRYDLALAAVPVAFLLGTVTHLVSPVSLRVALAAAAAAGVLVLADAVFLHPPGHSPPR